MPLLVLNVPPTTGTTVPCTPDKHYVRLKTKKYIFFSFLIYQANSLIFEHLKKTEYSYFCDFQEFLNSYIIKFFAKIKDSAFWWGKPKKCEKIVLADFIWLVICSGVLLLVKKNKRNRFRPRI